MNARSSRPSLDDDDEAAADRAIEARIAETARAAGVPSLTPAGAATSATTTDAPKEKDVELKLMVPADLRRQLDLAAATKGVTKRFLVLSALQSAGYSVEPGDLVEDGRRLRGSRAQR